MPVMADGVSLGVGEGSVTVTLHPHRLRVMAGPAGVAAATPTSAAVTEEDRPRSGAEETCEPQCRCVVLNDDREVVSHG
jgi:hypothetical protein